MRRNDRTNWFDALVTVQLHVGTLYAAQGDLGLCQVALEESVQLSEIKLGKLSVRTATDAPEESELEE